MATARLVADLAVARALSAIWTAIDLISYRLLEHQNADRGSRACGLQAGSSTRRPAAPKATFPSLPKPDHLIAGASEALQEARSLPRGAVGSLPSFKLASGRLQR